MDQQEQIRIIPESVQYKPTLENLVGEPRKFAETFLRDIEGEGVFRSMGITPDSTFLLYGPPATGKTLCLSAINNTANKELLQKQLEEIARIQLYNDSCYDGEKKPFPEGIDVESLNLVYLTYDIGKFGTAYINMGSRRVQQFFDTAVMMAHYGLKVLISLDECDALLVDRSSSTQSHGEDKKVLETIMKNVQVVHDIPGMYLALMTNLPEICDGAALRAGRIDRRIKFDLPNEEQRYKAFEQFIAEMNEKAKYSVIRNFQVEQLANNSDGFNYADIKAVVEKAVRLRAEEVLEDRTNKIIPAAYITQKRLMDALDKQRVEFHKKKGRAKIGY